VAAMNPDTIRSEVERLARAGKKIDAIKLVRERAGLGLKEAKEFVEALDRRVTEMHSTHSAHPTHAAHSTMTPLPEKPLYANAEQKAPSNFLLFLVIGMLIVLLGYLYIAR
jgi:hypothetical protein